MLKSYLCVSVVLGAFPPAPPSTKATESYFSDLEAYAELYLDRFHSDASLFASRSRQTHIRRVFSYFTTEGKAQLSSHSAFLSSLPESPDLAVGTRRHEHRRRVERHRLGELWGALFHLMPPYFPGKAEFERKLSGHFVNILAPVFLAHSEISARQCRTLVQQYLKALGISESEITSVLTRGRFESEIPFVLQMAFDNEEYMQSRKVREFVFGPKQISDQQREAAMERIFTAALSVHPEVLGTSSALIFGNFVIRNSDYNLYFRRLCTAAGNRLQSGRYERLKIICESGNFFVAMTEQIRKTEAIYYLLHPALRESEIVLEILADDKLEYSEDYRERRRDFRNFSEVNPLLYELCHLFNVRCAEYRAAISAVERAEGINFPLHSLRERARKIFGGIGLRESHWSSRETVIGLGFLLSSERLVYWALQKSANVEFWPGLERAMHASTEEEFKNEIEFMVSRKFDEFIEAVRTVVGGRVEREVMKTRFRTIRIATIVDKTREQMETAVRQAFSVSSDGKV